LAFASLVFALRFEASVSGASDAEPWDAMVDVSFGFNAAGCGATLGLLLAIGLPGALSGLEADVAAVALAALAIADADLAFDRLVIAAPVMAPGWLDASAVVGALEGLAAMDRGVTLNELDTAAPTAMLG
jgi:hypothetical protein